MILYFDECEIIAILREINKVSEERRKSVPVGEQALTREDLRKVIAEPSCRQLS